MLPALEPEVPPKKLCLYISVIKALFQESLSDLEEAFNLRVTVGVIILNFVLLFGFFMTIVLC
jgi:hypothetical protein